MVYIQAKGGHNVKKNIFVCNRPDGWTKYIPSSVQNNLVLLTTYNKSLPNNPICIPDPYKHFHTCSQTFYPPYNFIVIGTYPYIVHLTYS